MNKRIFLASPTMHGEEQAFIKEAFDTNWVAPLGKNVDEFEKEMAAYVGVAHAAALTAGTAALHLAVKLAGPGAYLYGESVMALLGLVPTDPSRVFVATPRRVRRSLPRGVRVVRVPGGEPGTVYDGIPSQKVALAIRSAESVVGRTRLLEAAREGRRLGYVRSGELEALEEEYGYGKET